MKFAIKRAELAAHLGRLASIAEKESTVAALSNVLIESMPGYALRLTATNLEITVRSETAADLIEEPGAMCVPASALLSLVRQLDDGLVTLRHDPSNDGGWVHVTAGRSKYRLPGTAAENYPPQSDLSNLLWLDVPSAALLRAIQGVAYASAPEEHSTYALKGARLELEGTELRFIAADGHRLAVSKAQLNTLAMDDIAVLVPQGGLSELRHLLPEAGKTVGIAFDDNRLYFQMPELRLTLEVGLQVGQFPEYNIILDSAKYEHGADFRTDQLAKTLKRILLVSGNKSYEVLFHFQAAHEGVERGRLLLTARTPDGDGEEQLETDWTGEDTKIPMNARLLLDFLGGVSGGSVRLMLGGTRSAMHLIGTLENPPITVDYILMPLNTPVS